MTATVLVALSVLATVLHGGMEEGREEEEGGLGLKGPDLDAARLNAEVWTLEAAPRPLLLSPSILNPYTQ